VIELSRDEIRQRLSLAVREAGSQRAFAMHAGVSACYVNDVLHGRRAPGARMLAALDVQRIERFVSKERS
jgi:DNA-binding transcriptional regulator YdaS (Cro superfamily)